MKKLLGCFLFLAAGSLMAANFYVAPQAAGTGTGESAANAAVFYDAALWTKVKTKRATEAVIVNFLPGDYVVTRNAAGVWQYMNLSLGNSAHKVTLLGPEARDLLISRSADGPSTERTYLIRLLNSGNVLIRNLRFGGTAKLNYALEIRNCTDVRTERLAFSGMTGCYYGAIGVVNNSENIVIYNTYFSNIGEGSSAHMIYFSNAVKNAKVQSCTFRNCSGDYVRFRDRCEQLLVENSTFESTGYFSTERPFIVLPVFNDSATSGFEYFSRDIIIRNCNFIRRAPSETARDHAFMFHHSGWNPPEYRYLMTESEGSAIVRMNRTNARTAMLTRTGIDFNNYVLTNNTFTNIIRRVVYECWTNYGSEDTYDPPQVLRNSFNFTAFFQ